MTCALEGGEGGSGKVDKSTDKLRDHGRRTHHIPEPEARGAITTLL